MSVLSLQSPQWSDINLSQIVNINGTPHATKASIGERLEYADLCDATNKIVERNSYLRRYSVAVKLTTAGGKGYARLRAPQHFCRLAVWPMPSLVLISQAMAQSQLEV
ncbi:hypothetical protein [Mycetohabitans rhizoxinica]|uniref:Uncharacterized protein n=1 Tax=Mycetohabitans rhizoxinica TaxID=412963 RepID=A0ABZ2Q0X4_9BURK